MPYANFRGLLLHTPICKKTHTVNTDQWTVLHFVLGPVHIGPFFPQKITHAKELHQSDRGSCRCHICSLHFGPWILASVDPPAKHIGIWGLGSTNDHHLSYFIIPVHTYHPYSKKNTSYPLPILWSLGVCPWSRFGSSCHRTWCGISLAMAGWYVQPQKSSKLGNHTDVTGKEAKKSI